ncbi:hypothetical protein XH87_10905 [Bradyrhizobium sp. CCBAU 53415]|nr:hypothetical protein [Bradyrhizobium sp. CCBAU 53415]
MKPGAVFAAAVALDRCANKAHGRSILAARLANDEEERREGTGSEPLFQSIAEQLNAAGIE